MTLSDGASLQKVHAFDPTEFKNSEGQSNVCRVAATRRPFWTAPPIRVTVGNDTSIIQFVLRERLYLTKTNEADVT